jgi:Uma2 family endonuclease
MASTEHAVLDTGSMPLTAPRPAEQLAEPGENRFLIRNIDWATYRQISEALNERHFHMSFDGKDLELMTISSDHSQLSRILGDFVVVLTEETGSPRKSTGEMTMDRKDLEKGIEADESFYLINEPKVRNKQKIDMAVDPPPDLGIEIDLTTDSRRRLGIYAKINVPEIWRYNGQQVTIYQRQSDGQYATAERSQYFAFLSAADLTRFLAQRGQIDESSLLLSFRKWVREQLAHG